MYEKRDPSDNLSNDLSTGQLSGNKTSDTIWGSGISGEFSTNYVVPIRTSGSHRAGATIDVDIWRILRF
jgi:hypothetical protein